MATVTQSTLMQELDTKKRSSTSRHFEDALRQKIVRQNEVVEALVELYQVFCAGLHSPGRPVGNLLFLGPTGSGKTRIVEAATQILFGDSRALIKVDCAEFQHSHEIAKLIGSPPGYLGYRETHPLITQEALAASHRGELKLSFLLFDEIEKASNALWQLLLGILDKATLTLGDNRRVDLSQTVIFLTSNLGGGEITELIQGGMGFIQPKDMAAKGLNEKVERTAVEAARRKFSPEFMNRLDKVVVFHPLKRQELDEVLDIEFFALADRGTLFLDEIGDMPLELQPKLLRVLQEREFEAVGSTRTTPVDVRVVVASNRDLRQMVRDREFREDLYYRLNTFPIFLPPLRERKGDIPEFVKHFVEQFATSMDKIIETIPEEVMSAIVRHPWPGNIRELQNHVSRGVILSRDGLFEPIALEKCDPTPVEISNPTLEDKVRQEILAACQQANWKLSGPRGAAARLGVKRTTLYCKMKRLGIAPPSDNWEN